MENSFIPENRVHFFVESIIFDVLLIKLIKTMMKAILSLILFHFVLSLNAQCTVEDIFPLPLGISKFDATSLLATKKNIIEDIEANQIPFFHEWDKPEYLKGDSVYRASLFYNFSFNSCLKGNENTLWLRFVDDVLFKMEIRLTFSSSEFEKSMENFNSLVNILKTQFPYVEEFIWKDSETKEQRGKGYTMYSIPADERDFTKIKEVDICYYINYKKEWNEVKRKHIQLGVVENYTIEIRNVDLKGTKLTNQGF